jgi:hypothetical protein
MQRTVELDSEMESELSRAVKLTRADPAVLLQQALRAGLPTIGASNSEPRPEGYFAQEYDDDPERSGLEAAMVNQIQYPER